MDTKKEIITSNQEKNNSNPVLNQRKEYQQPKLTSYGDISELVLMNAGVGGDGGAPPPLTFS